MNLVFIGCVQFSFATLSHLLSINHENLEIVGVITRESSPFNGDFSSLIPLATQNSIPYFVAKGNKQSEIFDWLKEISPDVIYCFGWSYLLKRDVLTLPALGVIGYHPAALPQNRGRHPIIWALGLGLSETGSTFFFMDEGADSGDILNQRFVSIGNADDAATLYQKLTEIACEQITEFTPQLISGSYERIAQDHSKANYWRKRGTHDGEVDWRMSAVSIYNLVRALTRPYVGAHLSIKGREFKVWKSEVVEEGQVFANIEPGKVLEVSGKYIIVKCGRGLLKLVEHELDLHVRVGDYL